MVVQSSLCGTWWKPRGQVFSHGSSYCLSFRFLTYSFLWAYNGWLLVNPSALCYDWQGGSIPLVESLCDLRNIAAVMAMAVALFLGYVSFTKFKVTIYSQSCIRKSPH